MTKILSLAMIATLLFGLVVVNISAIPSRDKQGSIEELDAYGIGVLDHYPSIEPTTADDYYKLGIAYLSRKAPQAAVEQFRKALEINPEHVDSLIGLAASTAQLGDAEAALEYSRKALKAEPNNARVHNAVGRIRMLNADSPAHFDEAESRFKKAVSLDPEFIPSRVNLALLYISEKKMEEAIGQYKAILQIQPENLLARRQLATLYLNTGAIDKALAEGKKIVEIAPQNPMAHNAFGEVYMLKSQLDEALAEFHQAVKLDPKYAQGYKNIGAVHFLRGSFDKAVEEYERALSFQPTYGDAYAGLGDVYLAKGMPQKAVEEYENAIGEDAISTLPIRSLVSVYNNLAYMYAEEDRNLDKALSLAQKAKQVAPDYPSIADTLGWVYYKKGIYDQAVANLEVAAKGFPDNSTIRYHLGLAYYMQGDKNKAETELDKALSIDTKFSGAEDARRLLAELAAK